MSGLKNTLAKFAKIDPVYKLRSKMRSKVMDADSPMGELGGLTILSENDRKRERYARKADRSLAEQRRVASGTMLGNSKLGD